MGGSLLKELVGELKTRILALVLYLWQAKVGKTSVLTEVNAVCLATENSCSILITLYDLPDFSVKTFAGVGKWFRAVWKKFFFRR